MKRHRLLGIEVDNLLGFLSLLGLLRALERSRPDWVPRAYFGGSPLAAHLDLARDATQEEIAEAASRGCQSYASAFTFDGYRDLTFGGDTARTLLERSLGADINASVMSALCSDAATRIKEDRVIPTPFCAMFGQGHQSFLSRLSSVSAGTLPGTLKLKKEAPNLNDPSFISRALFAPWKREDATESFRWDFVEDRRYALRFSDPSGDPPTTEHGANRLAVMGLLSFQSAPTVRRSKADLSTRAASRGEKDRRIRITWPIWYKPASLETIHAMLDEPGLARDVPSLSELGRFGIDQVRRSFRIMRGKFISFSRAEALILSDDQVR